MHRHVTPGDQVRHQTPLENAVRDAANAEAQRATREDMARPDRRREQDVVRIHNESGVDLERGDIVALGDPVIDPSEALDSWYHRPLFKGEYPLWQPQWKHPGRIGIMLEPCAVNHVASAVVSGCVQARVLVRDINHEYADVNWLDGGIRLTSTDGGSACVQILSIEESTAPAGECGTGSDERWAYVRVQNGGQFTLIGKVTTAFTPFHCDTGDCPPKGKVQVYFLNPTTECLQQITDRQGNLIYVCPYNNECRPIPIDEWVRLHCDRWATWWATPQEPVHAMLRAVDCIKPGDTTGTATVQKQGSAGYETDAGYADPVTVDNTDCLVFALPGELFPARREGCCTAKWIPDGPYGLTRRVRINTCIGCDAAGTATVLQSTCGGSGGGGCDPTDSPCTITACNPSGRPIAPCGPEESVANMTPGVRGSESKDCCWYLQAGPYPTRATGTLGSKLCAGGSGSVSGVEFPTYCKSDPEWPKPTTANNPYGLAGCSGAAVELVPKFTGCTCEWDIVMVQPIAKEIIADLRANCEGGCTVEKAALKEVLIWSCDDSVCETPTWETLLTGTMVDVLIDLASTCTGGSGCDGKGLEKSYAQVCVLCAGESPSPETIPFTSKTFMQVVKVEEGEEECSSCELRYETVTLCGLWCEAATGDTVAFTAESVSVPTNFSIACDGIHYDTKTVFALCVCDGESGSADGELTGEIVGGTCIEVERDEEACTTTINNTMTLAAGDCISVEGEGCEKTINNTMNVVGGCGISVRKSGCTYSVEQNSANGPKVTLQVLCGVEISPIEIACVEGSGGWSFNVTGGEVTEKFTNITLPASGVEFDSDCGSSGGGPDPPDDPLPSCDDCPDCDEGYYKIVNLSDGSCDCAHDNDLWVPPGWMACPPDTTPPDPPESGITLLELDCDGDPPHFAFCLNSMPTGAVNYTITVDGDLGSHAVDGPSSDSEEGPDSEHWGALVEGWGSPQPGESFTFVVEFKDAAGNVVATQTFGGACE